MEEPGVPASQDAADPGERVGNVDASGAVSAVPEGLVLLVEATIETIDQALVAVAVRAEAAEQAAAAAVAAAATAVPAPAVSVIPAAPSTSYVAGRVGGRPNGYARSQRGAGQAPRRVAPGQLPMVEVKMNGGRAVVQNQEEVAAARAARMAQSSFTPEVEQATAEFDGTPSG